MKVGTDEAEVLSRVTRWAETEERVRVVLLTSSRADPHAPRDLLSDYDVALIVADAEPFVGDDGWLRGVGTPLLRVRDTERMLGVTKHNCMVLYDDGTKIDYSLWPLAIAARIRESGTLPVEFDVGYRVVLDKERLTRDWPPPTATAHIPRQPTEREFQDLVQEFWWVATYVAKNLWRDELVPTKVLLDYELKYLVLRRLLEWRLEIDHGWSVRPGFFGKGLERLLDPGLWAAFERTYVGPGRAENWDALFETTDLFRRVAVDVGRALGFAYPHDLDARLTAYLRRIQDLDQRANDGP